MITVAGLSPSLDITYLVDRLRPGQIHRPYEVHRRAGGKPLNLARAAAVLGHPPTVVAVLGGAIGDGLRSELEAGGITVRTVPSPVETRVCASVAGDDADGLTEFYAVADAIPPAVWADFVAALEYTLSERGGSGSAARDPRSDWLAIAGGPPRGLAESALADLVRIGHRCGVRVALDTHGPALQQAVAAAPDLVKINRDEAAGLLDRPPRTELTVLADGVADLLIKAGAAAAPLVILTDGAAGALAVQGDQAVRAGLPGHVGRFPVGSGDAFLGGLLSALEEGAGLTEAMRLAAAAGTANALVPGAGEFDSAVARRLAIQVDVGVIRTG